VNKVVARFIDGRTVKGSTINFLPTKDRFHLTEATADAASPAVVIRTDELKALFFVKDFDGDPRHVEKMELDPSRAVDGRPIRVSFEDGEVLFGTTTGYEPDRSGFFLTPADPDSNNRYAYVVAAAATDIRFT
jgi:hypothetical protein